LEWRHLMANFRRLTAAQFEEVGPDVGQCKWAFHRHFLRPLVFSLQSKNIL
jgi:hypothetical protein